MYIKKINDLRVGNYIFLSGFGVICVDENVISYIINQKRSRYEYIGIGESILSDLGFQEEEGVYSGYGFDVKPSENRHNWLISYNGNPLTVKEYIHELQNLIYLVTGQELIINSYLTELLKP